MIHSSICIARLGLTYSVFKGRGQGSIIVRRPGADMGDSRWEYTNNDLRLKLRSYIWWRRSQVRSDFAQCLWWDHKSGDELVMKGLK
jgi:hypothetical protein